MFHKTPVLNIPSTLSKIKLLIKESILCYLNLLRLDKTFIIARAVNERKPGDFPERLVQRLLFMKEWCQYLHVYH